METLHIRLQTIKKIDGHTGRGYRWDEGGGKSERSHQDSPPPPPPPSYDRDGACPDSSDHRTPPDRLGWHSTSRLSLILTWLFNTVMWREREREVLMLVMEGRQKWGCETTYLTVAGGGRLVDHLEARGGGGVTLTIPSVSTALPTRQLLSEEWDWGCHTQLSPPWLGHPLALYWNYIMYGNSLPALQLSCCHGLMLSYYHGVIQSWNL